MKNFFTVFLKIIMVVSFVAVISFVILVLVNNVNVAYDSYNYIYSAQKSASYDSFADKVDRYVRKFENDTSIVMIKDDRALFLNDAMVVLNSCIDYYVDYLSVENNLSKAEQSTLSKSYSSYKEKFEYTKTRYNDYMGLLNSILGEDGFSHNWTSDDIAKRTFLTSREETLRLAYKDTYLAGSSFFKTLLDNVRRHSQSKSFTFNNLLAVIKIAYADEALQEVFAFPNLNISEIDSVRDFYKAKAYGSSSGDYSDQDMLVDNSLWLFVQYMSKLDVFSLIDDYNSFLDTLPQDKKEMAVYCKHFLETNILGV